MQEIKDQVQEYHVFMELKIMKNELSSKNYPMIGEDLYGLCNCIRLKYDTVHDAHKSGR